MILKNYSISIDLIAIETEGQYLDLHNNYAFDALAWGSDSVVIGFKLITGNWVPHGLPEAVLLRIDETTYFERRGKPGKNIAALGFFQSSTGGKAGCQGINFSQADADVLVVKFVGGSEIAVAGKVSTCSIQKCV